MKKSKALRNIAVAIAVTHADRQRHITLLNYAIDTAASAKSPSLTETPGGHNLSSVVASAAEKIERLESIRNSEQERVNAVEWAEECVRSSCAENDAPHILEAIYLYLNGESTKAKMMATEQTGISEYAFGGLIKAYTRSIQKYLHLID